MVFAARLTQRGHKISTMEDLLALYEQSFSDDTLSAISSLPHPTVQKFSVITVAIVGASRRFLAQITRHQNEVKFMSASLQYSNYAGQADFATPQGLRNVLIISATPYQWKHIIGQRVCRRNTDETRTVLIKIWQELFGLSPALFAPQLTGSFCQRDKCLEGKMNCGKKIAANMTPSELLAADYPLLMGVGSHED